jgi:hypothetical protein
MGPSDSIEGLLSVEVCLEGMSIEGRSNALALLIGREKLKAGVLGPLLLTENSEPTEGGRGDADRLIDAGDPGPEMPLLLESVREGIRPKCLGSSSSDPSAGIDRMLAAPPKLDDVPGTLGLTDLAGRLLVGARAFGRRPLDLSDSTDGYRLKLASRKGRSKLF